MAGDGEKEKNMSEYCASMVYTVRDEMNLISKINHDRSLLRYKSLGLLKVCAPIRGLRCEALH